MSGRAVRQTMNGRVSLPIHGRSFELLDTQLPVDVEIYRDSALLERWEDVEAGTRYDVPGDEADFDEVVIITSASESVKYAISDGVTTFDQRPQWYDRNPIAFGLLYNAAGVAPHAQTTRWSYTVPTGKKAMIEVAQSGLLRDAASGAPATAQAFVKTTGLTTADPIICIASHINGAVGTRDQSTLGSSCMLLEGDGILGSTKDDSTGGTNYIQLSAKGTEFNA